MYGMTDSHSGGVMARLGFELREPTGAPSLTDEQRAAALLAISIHGTGPSAGDPFAIYNPEARQFER